MNVPLFGVQSLATRMEVLSREMNDLQAERAHFEASDMGIDVEPLEYALYCSLDQSRFLHLIHSLLSTLHVARSRQLPSRLTHCTLLHSCSFVERSSSFSAGPN